MTTHEAGDKALKYNKKAKKLVKRIGSDLRSLYEIGGIKEDPESTAVMLRQIEAIREVIVKLEEIRIETFTLFFLHPERIKLRKNSMSNENDD